MKRITRFTALVLIALVACNNSPTPSPLPPTPPTSPPSPPAPPSPAPPSPTKGQLQLTVNGLPNDQAAAVALILPDGSSQAITASTTLNELTPGEYTLSAKDVVTAYTFKPQPLDQALTLTAGQTVQASVNYVAITGALEYHVSGLLAGQAASLGVSGVSGTFSFTGDMFLPNLEPGAYRVGNIDFFPRPSIVSAVVGFDYTFNPPTTILVKPGETAPLNLEVVASSGTLAVRFVGLPSEANAVFTIEGFPVQKSGFVNYLTPKLNDIKASNIVFNDFNYSTNTTAGGVNIRRGEVVTIDVPYKPVDGKLRVTVSNPPPDPAEPLRVRGPAGFDSGALNSSTTFSHLTAGMYTMIASNVTINPNKPGCTVFAPNLLTQIQSVIAGESVTASVVYTKEPCN